MNDNEALFLYGDFNFRLDLQSVVKVVSFTVLFVFLSVLVLLDFCYMCI